MTPLMMDQLTVRAVRSEGSKASPEKLSPTQLRRRRKEMSSAERQGGAANRGRVGYRLMVGVAACPRGVQEGRFQDLHPLPALSFWHSSVAGGRSGVRAFVS